MGHAKNVHQKNDAWALLLENQALAVLQGGPRLAHLPRFRLVADILSRVHLHCTGVAVTLGENPMLIYVYGRWDRMQLESHAHISPCQALSHLNPS